MNPVLLHGRTTWDRGYFPPDEFEERLRLVQAALREAGLAGLLVAGGMLDYANLCYLTGYIPWAGWSMAVVPVHGEMTLITGVGGGRELPVARPRTWVMDVRNLKNLGDALRQVLTEREIAGRLGAVSLDSLGPRLEARLRSELEATELVEADSLLAKLRQAARSREHSAITVAARIAQHAATTLRDVHASGASNASALIEAEYEARRSGALDFRGLVSQDVNGELGPIDSANDFRDGHLTGYLAVNSMGYWADLGVTIGAPKSDVARARAAVEAMASAARAGATTGEVASSVEKELGINAFHQAQVWGFGGGIGLALHQPPTIEPGGQDRLLEGMVLTLRVRTYGAGKPGVLVSDLVRVTESAGISVF